jgi:hypothetical protein
LHAWIQTTPTRPELPLKNPVILLVDNPAGILRNPFINLFSRKDLTDIRLVLPIPCIRQAVCILNVTVLIVWKRQNQMTTRIQQLEHPFHCRSVVDNMLKHTKTCYGIETFLDGRICYIIVDNAEVPVEVSAPPITLNPIDCRYSKVTTC